MIIHFQPFASNMQRKEVDLSMLPWLENDPVAPRIEKKMDEKQPIGWLSNIFTVNQCDQIIQQSEKLGFEERKFEAKGANSSSCIFVNTAMANYIFTLCKDYLPDKSYFNTGNPRVLDDYKNTKEIISHWGTLSMCGPLLRIERYQKGQLLKVRHLPD